jgi:DMSO/TMAO reductase YedYZ molybdopterin-dependent catalytic subunit
MMAGRIMVAAMLLALAPSGIASAASAAGPVIQLAQGAAPTIAVSGAVERPATLSLDDLRKLPATTEAVFFHTGHGAVNAVYTGVSLWTLLASVGLKKDPAVRNEGVHRYLVVKAADGYYAVLALAELDPEFGGQQAMLAYEQDGKPLDGKAGFARLIMPGDKGGGRDVMNVTAIELRTAEP